ncbi:MAG: prepilin-type N-terminal cleavage/methylation domain-containing protein [Candidatus Rokubacteria bacterium]|nr:prepilin-type N-terminal cleavage/methylation domain-containing protein [Candidatus Rokubacteria bacterium]
MVRERIRRLGARRIDSDGFSLAELIVVIAVIGALAVLGMPTFLTYWRTSTLRAGAQEAVTVLNSGRQLAIRENQWLCILGDVTAGTYGAKLRYIVATGASCSGTQKCADNGNTAPCIWTGPGTDGSGYMTLANRMQVKAPETTVKFSYLGAANPAGSFFVRDPDNTGACARLAVAASGRITTTYLGSGC